MDEVHNTSKQMVVIKGWSGGDWVGYRQPARIGKDEVDKKIVSLSHHFFLYVNTCPMFGRYHSDSSFCAIAIRRRAESLSSTVLRTTR